MTLVLFFILGLCFGSFVNMLIYRTAKQYGILKNKNVDIKNNRSFCDYCGKQLSWSENIPVVSWLILGGKTRCCQKKLPLSYPVVELSMGILFIFNFQFLISNDQLNLFFVLFSFLIVILLVFSFMFDWKYMILPDFATVILIVSALILWFLGYFGQWNYFLVALVSASFLLILNLITKGNGMGMGDVKLAIFMGLFLGYPKVILAFYVAFVVGAIYGLILMILKKADKKSQVPFGPFLILGIFIAWWWGDWIINLIGRRFF